MWNWPNHPKFVTHVILSVSHITAQSITAAICINTNITLTMFTITMTYTNIIFALLLILHVTIIKCLATMTYLKQNMWSFNTVWSVNPDGLKYSCYHKIFRNI